MENKSLAIGIFATVAGLTGYFVARGLTKRYPKLSPGATAVITAAFTTIGLQALFYATELKELQNRARYARNDANTQEAEVSRLQKRIREIRAEQPPSTEELETEIQVLNALQLSRKKSLFPKDFEQVIFSRPLNEDRVGEFNVTIPGVIFSTSNDNILDVYTQLGRLGEGGMKRIFLSIHHWTVDGKTWQQDDDCAMILVDEPEKARWANRGYDAIIDVPEHENVLQPISYLYQADLGRLVAVEPLYPASLDQVQLPFKAIMSILAQVARGLDQVHGYRIVHNDIKDSNIALFKENGKVVAKLTDWDTAKQLKDGEDACDEDHHLGTPMYLAPERLAKLPYDCKADVWAFGVMAYRLLLKSATAIEDPEFTAYRKEQEKQQNLNPIFPAFIAKAFAGKDGVNVDKLCELFKECKLPENLPVYAEGIRDVIRCAFFADPNLRPSASQIVAGLQPKEF